jgi:oxygen-independent coproporphyrinogen-3 oxidase
MINRRGRAADLPEKLCLAAEYFPGAFSADLIAGLPEQDETVLLRDVETLLSFTPAHVSLYSLTVEPDTPLAEKLRSGAVRLGDTDTADRIWIAGRDALEQAGYTQYEVSNFALPGKESRHNIRYWRMENWLGMGPAASGTVIDDDSGIGMRYTYAADVDAYIGGSVTTSGTAPMEEVLDPLTLMKETLLMGFRYIEGPDETLFRKRFGSDIEAAIKRTITVWRGRGLLRSDKAALTREGLLLLDPFLIEAFRELEG